ncbi:MAG TPA: cytochrome c [bacterium]|nr:cytochrome c [bacterium]
MKPFISALAALAVGFFAAAHTNKATPSPTASKNAGLAPPPSARLHRESLPPLARSILAQRMENHASQMTDLVWAVVFLEHSGVKEGALEIAGEPKIARPIPGAGADDLSSQLPARFFDMQDEVTVRAKELAAAAADDDDEKVADAWGRLSKACVECHAAYLEESR